MSIRKHCNFRCTVQRGSGTNWTSVAIDQPCMRQQIETGDRLEATDRYGSSVQPELTVYFSGNVDVRRNDRLLFTTPNEPGVYSSVVHTKQPEHPRTREVIYTQAFCEAPA